MTEILEKNKKKGTCWHYFDKVPNLSPEFVIAPNIRMKTDIDHLKCPE